MPDENPQEFYRDLAGVTNDPNIEIIPEGVYRPASPPSGIENEMFQALEGSFLSLIQYLCTPSSKWQRAHDLKELP